jgi:hypothetical protein
LQEAIAMSQTLPEVCPHSQSLTPAEISEFERIAEKLGRLESLVSVTVATALEIQDEMERARMRVERRLATEAAAAIAVELDRAEQGARRGRA